MPVVHRAHGLSFVIYTDDHLPADVHVAGRGSARFAIDAPDVRLLDSRGMSQPDLRRALDVIRLRIDFMLTEWTRIHG